MRISKRIPEIVGLVALVFVGACDTLNIANPNDPDRRRALGDANSIPSVAQGAFQTWYLTSQGGFGEDQYPALTMSVMARSHVAMWNNYHIRYYTGCTTDWAAGGYPAPLGTCGNLTEGPAYPRAAWANSLAAAERTQIEAMWYGYYASLSSANDALVRWARGRLRQLQGRADREHDGGAAAGVFPPRCCRKRDGRLGSCGQLRIQGHQLRDETVQLDVPPGCLHLVVRLPQGVEQRHDHDAGAYPRRPHDGCGLATGPVGCQPQSQSRLARQALGRRDVPRPGRIRRFDPAGVSGYHRQRRVRLRVDSYEGVWQQDAWRLAPECRGTGAVRQSDHVRGQSPGRIHGVRRRPDGARGGERSDLGGSADSRIRARPRDRGHAHHSHSRRARST